VCSGGLCIGILWLRGWGRRGGGGGICLAVFFECRLATIPGNWRKGTWGKGNRGGREREEREQTYLPYPRSQKRSNEEFEAFEFGLCDDEVEVCRGVHGSCHVFYGFDLFVGERRG
jgi:hypothetical protein